MCSLAILVPPLDSSMAASAFIRVIPVIFSSLDWIFLSVDLKVGEFVLNILSSSIFPQGGLE